MMNYGETPEKALAREIDEELGVKVTIHELLHAQTNIYQDGKHYLVLFYVCTTRVLSTLKGCEYYFPYDIDSLSCLKGTPEVVRMISNRGYNYRE